MSPTPPAETVHRTITVDLDGPEMARAEAYAATKRRTVGELVQGYLRAIGNDYVEAELPRGACNAFLRMHRHGGRDTTAGFLADGAWDEFERPMPGYFYAWARLHPGIVIDGGANTGFYALLAANASERNQVLAFEPDPLVRGLLQENIEANGLVSRVSAHAAALSDRNGRGMLHIPTQDHGVIETSSSLETKFKSRFSEVLEVETLTIDRVVGTWDLHGQPVRLIKIDVAGHEGAALAGAERTLADHRPVVFAEVLDRADFGLLSQFIARHNYTDVPLRSQGALAGQGTVTFEGDAWNHALVPAELLPRFLVAARSAA